MNQSAACNDDSFGPVVAGCRDDFDFTLVFEESIFTILPSALFLCFIPLRFWSIYRRPDAVKWPRLLLLKLITIVVLSLLKLSLLILWALPGAERTKTTIAAAALDLAAAIAMGILSPVEHTKSLRPSTLLSVFLFCTMVLDIARARTEWLLQTSDVIPSVFVTALAVKVILLLLEAISKAHYLKISSTPELTSSIFSRSFLAWLNPLIYIGNRQNLEIEDLYPVDPQISSKVVNARVQKEWEKSAKDKYYSLAWAIAKALWIPLTSTFIPKLFLIGFSILQPFIIEDAINFAEGNDNMPNRYGYGLIGAYAISYIGIAISTAWYEYLSARALTMINTALIGIIYTSTFDLETNSVQASSAVSLMGADVERVISTLRWVIGILPDIIQVALAIWILEERLGAICVAPVIIVLLSALASSQVGKYIRPRQRQWMQAVQKRVAVTSDMLGYTKGTKMLGLSKRITAIVQGLRDSELSLSKRFRKIQITNITLGNAPNLLSPMVTFVGYAIVIKLSSDSSLSVSRIFSALSLLSMLINPIDELVAAYPNLASALDCCNRIQEYITGEQRHEIRSISTMNSSKVAKDFVPTLDDAKLAIQIKGADAGWSADRTVLHKIDIQCDKSTLSIIVGPVGCGKTTLLKLILGEVIMTSGSVALSTDSVAYCDQTSFIANQTFRENIVGPLDFDADWYVSCTDACALDVDFQSLDRGDETIVGSKGNALSGGQKQRIALARAVYARKSLILLDDSLSGLDMETERHCFQRLLGQDGLMRRIGATIVLATHSVKWLPYSDRIVVLNSEGKISQNGSFETLSAIDGYISDLSIKDFDTSSAEQSSSRPKGKAVTTLTEDNAKKNTVSKDTQPTPKSTEFRGKRDLTNITYYLKVMGYLGFAIFLAFVTIEVVCQAIQPVWLNWWVDANVSDPNANLGRWLGIYAMFGVLGLAFLGISGGFFLIRLVPKSASTLHYDVLKTTMSAPMSFFTSTDSGIILNRFTQDMTLMDMQLPMTLLLTIEKFGGSIAQAILTCISSGYTAISLPFLGIALYFLQGIYLKTSRQIRLLELEAKSPVFSHFTETIDGMHTIRAFMWREHAISQNFQLIDLSQRPSYLLLCIQAWLNLVLDMMVACIAIILIVVTVTLRNTAKGSLLGVAMISVMNLSQTLSSFVTYWTGLETSLGAVARTKQYKIATPSEEMPNPKDLPDTWPLQTDIELRNVSASYQESGSDVLHDINLIIPAGQRFAICGRTGSGKSTLISLLLRLLNVKTGSVLIGNEDISLYPCEAIRGRLNAMPQEAWFLPKGYGTIRLNIDPLEEATDVEIQTALSKTGLLEHIQSAGGLDAEISIDKFSHGQRQLFCLARAMILRRCNILLLDEATSSVDEKTEEVMMSLLRTEFQGWTVISVAHRLKSILDFDKVVVIDQGRIVECDSPMNLLAYPTSAFARLSASGGL